MWRGRGATVGGDKEVWHATPIGVLWDGGIASPHRDLAIGHRAVANGSTFAIDVFLGAASV